MKKIAIVADSSISLTPTEVEQYDVFTVPIAVIHNEETYLDQVTITDEEVYNLLARQEKVTTSLPSIGSMIKIFETIKEENYDYTIVLSVSSVLSGTINGFYQAAKQSGLENYFIIDTKSIAGPVQQAVKAIRAMNKSQASIEEIIEYLDYLFSNQTTYLYTQNLDQIVASGRLSKTGGKIASLLKVKVALYFDDKSSSIERLAITRTDKKIYQSILDDLKERKIIPKDYDIYFLEGNAKDEVEKLKNFVFNELGIFDYKIVNLPASLSVHAGAGAIVLQYCPKF